MNGYCALARRRTILGHSSYDENYWIDPSPRFADIDPSASDDYRKGYFDGRRNNWDPPLFFGKDDYKAGYVRAGGHVLGDGSDTGGIVSNVFDFFKQGTANAIQSKQDKDAAAKATRDSAADLQAAKAADQIAKDALGKALVSEDLKLPSASADRLAANMALSAEDIAASGLSPDNQKKRAEAAMAAVQKATAEWQAASAGKDTATARVKELWVQAAQQIYAKTQNALISQAATLPGGIQQMAQPSQSWVSKPVLGPIPGGVVVGGIVAILATILVAIKR